jgi:hypothetical protein
MFFCYLDFFHIGFFDFSGLGHNYLALIPTDSLAEVKTSLWRLNLAENYFPTLGSLKGKGKI